MLYFVILLIYTTITMDGGREENKQAFFRLLCFAIKTLRRERLRKNVLLQFFSAVTFIQEIT